MHFIGKANSSLDKVVVKYSYKKTNCQTLKCACFKASQECSIYCYKGERICKNIKEKGYTEVGLRGKSDSDSEGGDSEGGDSDSEALDLQAQLIVK